MKAILIDPVERVVKYIDLADYADGESELKVMAKALGCEYVERVPLDEEPRGPMRNGIDLWIDDEGRCTYPNPNGYFMLDGQIFCGRGLVLGCYGPESKDVPEITVLPFGAVPVKTLELLQAVVEFPDTPAEADVAPSFTITTF